MSFTRGFRKMGGFPKNGEMIDDRGRFSRDGWTHRADHDSVYINGKQYRNMQEWTRPCVVCGEAVTAYEKKGMVDASSRFGNRTCKNHRGLLPALERGFIVWNAELKGIVPGASCVSGTVPAAELETLRTANATMKEELDCLYAANKELREKLAKYEPGPALEAAVPAVRTYKLPPEPLTMAESTERLRKMAAELAKNSPQKMPWEA